MSSPIIIGDAGLLIGFIASDNHQLLVDLIPKISGGGKLQIPLVVKNEIQNYANKPGEGKVRNRLAWLIEQKHTTVLPDVNIDSNSGVIATVAAIRDRSVDQALDDPKDLGETLVVAHAVAAKKRGVSHIYVAIDDAGGRRLAKRYGLHNLITEDFLQLCVKSRIITSSQQLRARYDEIAKKSALPRFQDTDLARARFEN